MAGGVGGEGEGVNTSQPQKVEFPETEAQSSFLNCSTVMPASRAIPPIVKAFTGFARGMVTNLTPSLITTCFPWRRIRNPAFSNAFTASR